MKRNIASACLAVTMGWVLLSGVSWAAGVRLRWQANPESDLRGYNVYYGTRSRSYSPPVPAGDGTEYLLSNLQEGTTYYFAVTAVDNAGNESGYSSEGSVTIPASDVQPPVVVITGPTTASSFATETALVDLSGRASDDRSLDTVTWSTSGGQRGTASGIENWSVSGIQLAQGETTVTVTATDTAGNKATDSLTVTYVPPDTTPPSVTIVTPTSEADFTTSSSRLDLSGTASDDRSLASVTWAASDGRSGTAAGTADWSIQGIDLGEGETTIFVTAMDRAGNRRQDSLTVTVLSTDTVPPTLTILSPFDPAERAHQFTDAPTLEASGVAADEDGIQRVEWRNSLGDSGVCVGTDQWRVTGIPLERRWNTVTFTAFDRAGNSTAIDLTVFCKHK